MNTKSSAHQSAAIASCQSEERFRLMVDAVQDYAIFMLDPEGHVISWNAGAERIKGYQAPEIMGKHFSCFYPEKDIMAAKPQRELEIAGREGRFADEGWRVRKDGSRFWASVVITALRDENGRLSGYGKITRDFTERRKAEDTLRQSEERFRLMVDAVQDYAIFTLDPEGRITSWNVGAERIKGYLAREIMGKHFSCFYPENDIRSGKPQRILDIATREGRAEQEGWRVRKDGSRFWATVLVTALRDRSGKLVGFSKVTRDSTERMEAQTALQKEMTQRREAQAKLSESEQSLRRLSLHLLRTQDEERRRIGREMHDSLGQYLSVLKMKLDALKSAQPSHADQISRELTQCASLLAECVKEVRTISYLLYPPMLEEMGLKSAIPWYLDGFTQRSGIETAFEISDDFERLPRDLELALFRVLQESLTNVHKHSGSATADIRLLRANEAVSLEITDHGKGIPQETLEQSGPDWMGSLGIGLRGMRERMRQLGGTFDVSSAETGTTVRATVPLPENPSASVGYQQDSAAPQLGL